MKATSIAGVGLAIVGALALAGCHHHHREKVVVVREESPPPHAVIVEHEPAVQQEVVIVHEAPPPARVEVVGHPPEVGVVWVGGYWSYHEHHYVWVGGHWGRPPHPGAAGNHILGYTVRTATDSTPAAGDNLEENLRL